MSGDPRSMLPDAPRLPERAAIYIAPDGTVTFGALFEGLVPVAESIAGKRIQTAPPDAPGPDAER